MAGLVMRDISSRLLQQLSGSKKHQINDRAVAADLRRMNGSRDILSAGSLDQTGGEGLRSPRRQVVQLWVATHAVHVKYPGWLDGAAVAPCETMAGFGWQIRQNLHTGRGTAAREKCRHLASRAAAVAVVWLDAAALCKAVYR